MKLSKYAKWIEINNGRFALFNTLLMDVIYLSLDELEKVKKFNVSASEEKLLLEKGIYIKDSIQDEEAFSVISDKFIENTGSVEIMYLILAQKCNLGCKYCFLENKYANWKCSIMNEDTITVAVTKFAEYIKEHNIKNPRIVLFGGEPTINWNGLKLAVSLSKSLIPDVTICIVTNGTLITTERAKYFKENDIEVGISLDGPKIVNDVNRIFKGSNLSVYDRVMEGLDILNAENCEPGLSITVSKELLKHEEEVISWLKNVNVSGIYFNLMHYSENEEWELHTKNTIDFLIKAQMVLKEKGIYDGRVQRQIHSLGDKEFRYSDCGAVGMNQIVVKPDGKVVVCQCDYTSSKNQLGNIFNNSINEMLTTSNAEYWKSKITIFNPKCQNCECLYVCGGGCLTQIQNILHSNVDEPYCMYVKSTMKWLLKLGDCSEF